MYHRIVLCTALALTYQSQAENHQYQVNANYNDVDVEQGADISGYDVSGTYYLAPVDDSKGPLFEASFINRSSFVNLDYRDDNRDNKFSPDNDITHSTISGLYVSQKKGWFVGAAYNEGKNDAQTSSADSDGYQITLGRYIADNTTISISYDRNETDNPSTAIASIFGLASIGGFRANVSDPGLSGLLSGSSAFFAAATPISFNAESEIDNDSITIALRHLGLWSGRHYSATINYANGDTKTRSKTFINGVLSGDFKSEADTNNYGLDFAFYPANDWRFSLGYQKSDIDNLDKETYSVGINWFVTNKIALDLSYAEVKADSPNLTSNIFFNPFVLSADVLIPNAGIGAASAVNVYSSADFPSTSNDSQTLSLSLSLRF